jgi:hypothetical protein
VTDPKELMKQAGWGESERPALSERDGVSWKKPPKKDRRRRPERTTPRREPGGSGLLPAFLLLLVLAGAAIAGIEATVRVELGSTAVRAGLILGIVIGLWLALGSGRRLALTRLVGMLLVGAAIFLLVADDS